MNDKALNNLNLLDEFDEDLSDADLPVSETNLIIHPRVILCGNLNYSYQEVEKDS